MKVVVSKTCDLPVPALLEHVIRYSALNVVFQPIVATGTGGILGHEALIRGPRGSVLESPLKLVEAAAREGRLQALEVVILRFIARKFAEQRPAGRLFINVTPSTLLFLHDKTAEFRAYLDEVGLSPEQVVVEITENEPIDDYAITREVLKAYRRIGISFALDDVGGGYAGLRHLLELAPEYVKIERHFIQNLHIDDRKAALVRILQSAARSLKSKVIAEGVECEREFETLRRIGIPYAQGYFLGRPEPQCRDQVSPALNLSAAKMNDTGEAVTATAASLLRKAPAVDRMMLTNTVADRLDADAALTCVVLVDQENVPVGILTRNDVQACFSQNYGRALYGRKPAMELVRNAPTIVAATQSLESLSRQVTEENELGGDDHFVIVDGAGKYAGIGSMLDLLRRMTDLKVEAARHANPLSGLPGNVPIDRHVSGLLRRGEACVLAHFDLDDFKVYNDRYGYAAGDDVLRNLGELVRSVLHEGRDFAGHVGGDDYVVVFQSADWEGRCRQLLEDFDAMAPGFYTESDRTRNGFEALDREGRKTVHRSIALSIGAVVARRDSFKLHHELAHAASMAKTRAKSVDGSCLHVVDGINEATVFVGGGLTGFLIAGEGQDERPSRGPGGADRVVCERDTG